VTCPTCHYRDCTPEGLEYEPAAAGDGVAVLVCPCTSCHMDVPVDDRVLAAEVRIHHALAAMGVQP
jgi:hypothetical protein